MVRRRVAFNGMAIQAAADSQRFSTLYTFLTTSPDREHIVARRCRVQRPVHERCAETYARSYPVRQPEHRLHGFGRRCAPQRFTFGFERFVAWPDAVNYFEQYYTPTGVLQIPTLTLHTVLDPVVPFWHEAAYAQRTGDAGAGEWLVQRSIARYGHCAVTPAEMGSAFDALVSWAEGGPRPAGGDATLR